MKLVKSGIDSLPVIYYHEYDSGEAVSDSIEQCSYYDLQDSSRSFLEDYFEGFHFLESPSSGDRRTKLAVVFDYAKQVMKELGCKTICVVELKAVPGQSEIIIDFKSSNSHSRTLADGLAVIYDSMQGLKTSQRESIDDYFFIIDSPNVVPLKISFSHDAFKIQPTVQRRDYGYKTVVSQIIREMTFVLSGHLKAFPSQQEKSQKLLWLTASFILVWWGLLTLYHARTGCISGRSGTLPVCGSAGEVGFWVINAIFAAIMVMILRDVLRKK